MRFEDVDLLRATDDMGPVEGCVLAPVLALGFSGETAPRTADEVALPAFVGRLPGDTGRSAPPTGAVRIGPELVPVDIPREPGHLFFRVALAHDAQGPHVTRALVAVVSGDGAGSSGRAEGRVHIDTV